MYEAISVWRWWKYGYVEGKPFLVILKCGHLAGEPLDEILKRGHVEGEPLLVFSKRGHVKGEPLLSSEVFHVNEKYLNCATQWVTYLNRIDRGIYWKIDLIIEVLRPRVQ